jgi:hypothetical protein
MPYMLSLIQKLSFSVAYTHFSEYLLYFTSTGNMHVYMYFDRARATSTSTTTLDTNANTETNDRD